MQTLITAVIIAHNNSAGLLEIQGALGMYVGQY